MTDEELRKPTGRVAAVFGVLLLVAGLCYSGFMMYRGFGGFFQRGYLGYNGARYSIMARNVLRADLAATYYVPLLNAAEDPHPDPYLHHPPLLHWVMAVAFYCFGESEDQARAIPYAFTLMNLVLIFFLGRRLFRGALWGGICALLAAFMPLTSFYGAHIDVQGSPLIFFILAAVLCYMEWLDNGKKTYYVLAVVSLVVGTLFDWPALYLCALLPLHYWLTRRKEGGTWKETILKLGPFMATGVVLFVLLFAWLSLAAEPKGTSLFESFTHRTLNPSTFLDYGDPWQYLLKHSCFPKTHSLCPWPFLFLIFLGWLLGLFSGKDRRDPHVSRMLWILFFLGTIHMVIFPFGTLFHDYWIFLYMPWVALAGCHAVRRIVGITKSGAGSARAVAVIVVVAVLVGVLYSGQHYTDQRYAVEGEIEPYLLGKKIHEHVAPGQAVMINADHYNQPIPGDTDRYVLFKPALSYYADRVIRGNIQTPELFHEMLKRRDDFTYFIFINLYGKRHAELFEELKKHYAVEKEIFPGLVFFRLK